MNLGSYEGTSMATENVEETTCIFFPDKLPNQRQLCYQLCDIHDQEAQDLIHSNDGRETECMVCGHYIVKSNQDSSQRTAEINNDNSTISFYKSFLW